jgi:hypothetical protein
MCYHIHMYKCPDCQREFEKKQSYCSHRGHCKLHQRGLRRWDITPEKDKRALHESTYNLSPMPLCLVCDKPVKERRAKYCSSKCSRSAQLSQPKTNETRAKIRASLVRRLTSENRLIPERRCKICGKRFTPKMRNRACCSRKCGGVLSGISNSGKKRIGTKSGGYREGSGRSKSGWYKGIHCGSTYELIFLVYHLERKIPIQRSTVTLEYGFEGKKRRYHPDFDVAGTLHEVKGFWTAQSQAKHEQHPEVIIVDKNEIMRMQADSSLAGKTWHELVEIYDSSNVEFGNCAACGRRFCKPEKTSKYCCKKCREDVQFKRI